MSRLYFSKVFYYESGSLQFCSISGEIKKIFFHISGVITKIDKTFKISRDRKARNTFDESMKTTKDISDMVDSKCPLSQKI